ncbi:MAG: DUF5677 domain-containing protein [Thermoguttaceae bacterium]
MDKDIMTDDELLALQASEYDALANKLYDVLAKKLYDARRESSVTRAIELLLGRLVCAGKSLRVLRKHLPHDFFFDGAMILRGMYDTMLQALYIMSDPAQQESRATQYLDYYWIEKHKMIAVIDSSTTNVGQRLSRSTKRASAEPAIDKEFQRVRSTFENEKGKLRNQWYEGRLNDLAETVGFLSEYNILQKQLSGAVHSSPYALQAPLLYKGFPLMMFAWKFIFRVLGKFAVYKGITLEKHESDLIALSAKNIFDDYSKQL